jgi:hypothetical protein
MAILLLFNREHWDGMPKACRQTLVGDPYEDWWTVRLKDIPLGTRVFVLRVQAKERLTNNFPKMGGAVW